MLSGRTGEFIDVFANDVFNPRQVGRGTSEDAGLLIKDTADWTKTSDAVHLPGGRGVILVHLSHPITLNECFEQQTFL